MREKRNGVIVRDPFTGRVMSVKDPYDEKLKKDEEEYEELKPVFYYDGGRE
jgi:hypothetical protein